MDLRSAFEPDGVTAVVGAGGKKSTLYELAEELCRAVLTATVRIPPFEAHVNRLVTTDDPVKIASKNESWPLGLVAERDGNRNRYRGYDTGTIDEFAAATDVPILLKADGARTRWFKAPGADEPQLPSETDLVVPVASAKVVGERLNKDRVHRPERVASLLDRPVGGRIEPEDVATVLDDERGGLKDVPAGARIVPLINMVDGDRLESVAGRIADLLLSSERIDRIVLGRMDRGQVVSVVE